MTYICNTGYEVVGDNERECLCSAEWSGSEPICQGECCTRKGNNGCLYIEGWNHSCLKNVIWHHFHKVCTYTHTDDIDLLPYTRSIYTCVTVKYVIRIIVITFEVKLHLRLNL